MRKRVWSVVLALVLCLSCLVQCVAAQGTESLKRYGITDDEKETTIGFFKYIGAQDAVDTLTKGKYSKYVILPDAEKSDDKSTSTKSTDGKSPDTKRNEDATALENFATSLLFAELGNEYVSQSTMHKVLYMTDNSMARAEANADFLLGFKDEKEQSGELDVSDEPGTVSFFLPIPDLDKSGLDIAQENASRTDALYRELAERYLKKAVQENLQTLSAGQKVHYSYLSWAYNTRKGYIITLHQNEQGTVEEVKTEPSSQLVYCLGESDQIPHGKARTSYEYRMLLTEYYQKFGVYPDNQKHTWITRPAFYGRDLEGKFRKISPTYTFCLNCGAVKQAIQK